MSKWAQIRDTFNGVLGKIVKLAAAEERITLPAESVVISDRAVGGKAEKKNADNTLAPLDNGTYELSDGFIFTVEGGFITSIGEDEPVEDAAEIEAGAAAPATPVAPIAAEGTPPAAPVAPIAAEDAPTVESLRIEVDALKAELAEIKAMLTGTAELAAQAVATENEIAQNVVKMAATIEAAANKIPATPARTNDGLGALETKKANELDQMQRTISGAHEAAKKTLGKT
jgi:hypothetical protein